MFKGLELHRPLHILHAYNSKYWVDRLLSVHRHVQDLWKEGARKGWWSEGPPQQDSLQQQRESQVEWEEGIQPDEGPLGSTYNSGRLEIYVHLCKLCFHLPVSCGDGLAGCEVVVSVGTFTSGEAACTGFVKGCPSWAMYLSTSPLSSLPLGPVAWMRLGFNL